MTVLAAATGLAYEFAFGLFHQFAQCFTVGYLRLAYIGLNLEFTFQPIDDDLEVQFTHAGDDGLSGLLIG